MLTSASLAERLRVAVGRLARKLRQQSLGGLTPSQSSVLSSLDTRGPMSMSRLAEVEAISRPSTTGIVSRLIEGGLVVRADNPEDGRSAIVTITQSGSSLLQQRRQERNAFLARAVESLTDDEKLVLARAAELIERITARG
ncbi:MAG TPA: MarR family transcriptional regulator [Acidimicrobiia bacterium]|nr:MarR family transcriptional regulator [Acidimicrobiia bacterium]